MNLEAASMTDTRAWTWARFSMVVCFALASIMLLASLNMAEGSPTAPVDATSIQAGSTVR